jgi:hypothetical protein
MRKANRPTPASSTPKRHTSQGARTFKMLGHEGEGGHRARRGFRFQDRWLAFHLLEWVTDESFRGVVNEGIDDVDASWFHNGSSGEQDAFDWRIHQLKDTEITPAILSEILDSFRRKEAQLPATFSRYHVVASRCAKQLRSLPDLLDHARNARDRAGPGSAIGLLAVREFGDKLADLGITADAAFVIDRVELTFRADWLGDSKVFAPQFHLRLAGYGIPRESAAQARDALFGLISESVGKLITRAAVTELLDGFKPNIVVPRKAAPGKLPVAATARRRAHARAELDEPALISVFPGGAVLLRLPGGAYGLVDCGMVAAAQIVAHLAQRKVDTFDFVAISHWDSDRFNGVLSVLGAVKRVRKFLVPSVPGPWSARVSALLDQLRGEGRRRYGIGELAVTNARAVIWELVDGTGRFARVESFAADRFDPATRKGARVGEIGPAWSRNDLCTVFRVTVGDHSFLITSDASIKRWTHLLRRLLGAGESFRADGLTLPRHGSHQSLNQDILGAIADSAGFYAVVDPLRLYGLPHADVLQLVRAGNGEIVVCDPTPVHFLLTHDGLFERRFALGQPRGASALRGGSLAGRLRRNTTRPRADALDPLDPDYGPPPHPRHDVEVL